MTSPAPPTRTGSGRCIGRPGLSLTSDLRKLNSATRISADPAAVRYLSQNIIFNGRISASVLTMHTTGDGLVAPENEQAYRAVVDRAGNSDQLRQIFVARAGHCAFTPAENLGDRQDAQGARRRG